MHETSLMEQVLRIAESELAMYQVSKVNELELEIGVLANVIPEALEFAFEALGPGTLCKGARLKLVTVPAALLCQDCGHEFHAEKLPAPCPNCESKEAKITGGTEVLLKSIDFEEED